MSDSGVPVGCTCARLRKLTRRITQHYDACLAPAGLRVTQFSLLANLVSGGPAGMTALADALDMDRTTLTRSLKPLVDARLVEIGVGRDARERQVAITSRGTAAWREARPLWRRAQEEVNRAIGPRQVAALHGLVEESLATFKSRARGEGAPRAARRRTRSRA
jgi:DNA-binding MarR family transcriptional regulator